MSSNNAHPGEVIDLNPLIEAELDGLKRTGRLAALRGYRQHGAYSVYDHVVAVAAMALRIAGALHLRVDETALVRGALLHDYFLYDWHVPDPDRPLHGFYHPKAALANAQRDYGVNALEADIILRHMFPLTLVPPRTREGLVVCIADKVCALRESLWRRHGPDGR